MKSNCSPRPVNAIVLRMREERMIPQDQLNEYIATHVERAGYWTSADRELAERIDASLRAGLERLNALPASDPFWVGTNRRPTIFKAEQYFQTVLATHADDIEARWTLIALALYACDNDFGRDLLTPLVSSDVRQIRWLVGAAAWVHNMSGYDTTRLLRQCLRDLDRSSRTFRCELGSLCGDSDAGVAQAARVALSVLTGNNPR